MDREDPRPGIKGPILFLPIILFSDAFSIMFPHSSLFTLLYRKCMYWIFLYLWNVVGYWKFIVRWPNVNALTLIDIPASFKNDYSFDFELDFDLMSIEAKEMDNDEPPEEIKEWVEDKSKPNLEQIAKINLGTPKKPKEL